MRDRWPSERERWWPSNDLIRIDAGERAIGVQFRVKTTRAEHADSPEEARKRARGAHMWVPRWDYRPTGNLRLFLYHDTHSAASWEDTARISVENRLTAVHEVVVNPRGRGKACMAQLAALPRSHRLTRCSSLRIS